MTSRDMDAALVPDENDPVALAFRHYLLALRSYRHRKQLQLMPLETEAVRHARMGDRLASEPVAEGVKMGEHIAPK